MKAMFVYSASISLFVESHGESRVAEYVSAFINGIDARIVRIGNRYYLNMFLIIKILKIYIL
jgi:hypothetical protein